MTVLMFIKFIKYQMYSLDFFLFKCIYQNISYQLSLDYSILGVIIHFININPHPTECKRFPHWNIHTFGRPLEAAVRAFPEKPRGFRETVMAVGGIYKSFMIVSFFSLKK